MTTVYTLQSLDWADIASSADCIVGVFKTEIAAVKAMRSHFAEAWDGQWNDPESGLQTAYQDAQATYYDAIEDERVVYIIRRMELEG